jgi:hypothetical protein
MTFRPGGMFYSRHKLHLLMIIVEFYLPLDRQSTLPYWNNFAGYVFLWKKLFSLMVHDSNNAHCLDIVSENS